MSKARFPVVHIFGPGLMGASLALAIRKNKIADRIALHDRSGRKRSAADRRAIPAEWLSGTAPETLRDADLVLLCLPVGTITAVGSEIRPYLRKGALVMDVGSTKGRICGEAGRKAGGVWFVGAHPMAGSEKKGLQGARADFFDSAWCFLDQTAPLPARRLAAAFWRSLGSRVVWVKPDFHDRMVAKISHLPHVVANVLLASLFANSKEKQWLRYAGGGLGSMLRISGTNAVMWRDIFAQNRSNILKEMKLFEKFWAQARKDLSLAPAKRMEQKLSHLEHLKAEYEKIRLKS